MMGVMRMDSGSSHWKAEGMVEGNVKLEPSDGLHVQTYTEADDCFPRVKTEPWPQGVSSCVGPGRDNLLLVGQNSQDQNLLLTGEIKCDIPMKIERNDQSCVGKNSQDQNLLLSGEMKCDRSMKIQRNDQSCVGPGRDNLHLVGQNSQDQNLLLSGEVKCDRPIKIERNDQSCVGPGRDNFLLVGQNSQDQNLLLCGEMKCDIPMKIERNDQEPLDPAKSCNWLHTHDHIESEVPNWLKREGDVNEIVPYGQLIHHGEWRVSGQLKSETTYLMYLEDGRDAEKVTKREPCNQVDPYYLGGHGTSGDFNRTVTTSFTVDTKQEFFVDHISQSVASDCKGNDRVKTDEDACQDYYQELKKESDQEVRNIQICGKDQAQQSLVGPDVPGRIPCDYPAVGLPAVNMSHTKHPERLHQMNEVDRLVTGVPSNVDLGYPSLYMYNPANMITADWNRNVMFWNHASQTTASPSIVWSPPTWTGALPVRPEQAQNRCDQCPAVFHTEQLLMQHRFIHFPQKPPERKHAKHKSFKCDQCDKAYHSKKDLSQHKRRHLLENRHKCDKCDEAFYFKCQLAQHKRSHLSEIPVPKKCDECGEVFQKASLLQRHILKTHRKPPYLCEQCGKTYQVINTLIYHTKTVHNERQFKCDQCEKTFKIKSYLKRHKAVHVGEKQHKCDQCEKAYSFAQDLRLHKRVHGERSFKCSQCDKAFFSNVSLTKHVQSVHPKQKFKCDLCKKELKTKTALRCHTRVFHHEGIKYIPKHVYSCDLCEKSFHRSQQLVNHRRLHTGERPFKCDRCEKAFTNELALTMHTLRHLDNKDKPFKCNQCEKAYITSHALSVHVAIHSADKPYKCNNCDKAYYYKGQLTIHKRLHVDDN